MTDALSRAQANSPFLAQLIERQPELVALLDKGDFEGALAMALSAGVDDDIAATLRRQRQGVALVTAIADLAGVWDLARVTRILSDFADHALDAAIAAAFAERVPDAPVQGFAVIALGKHGGQELNYSSDIDPIFLYDPETLPRREREDVADSAVRIGRRVIELLSARDENGYVFRVDMRLRPSPEVTPIAIPVEAAISYYESSALAWEQAAFIRARAAAGDRALGDYFLKSIQPFVWRRSLDFGQLANIRKMSGQIRDHYHKGQRLGPGYDLKRGRGGIRECEFFAQAHQLIHGGRDPGLRMADTRTALAALAERERIGADEAATLSSAYELLRTIEHRLQMLDDRQTHSLPENPADLDRAARLHGLADGAALVALLDPVVTGVGAIYDGLAGEEDESTQRLADEGLPLEDQLSALGYADPPAVAQRLARWRSGQLRAIRSSSAREAFETVLPKIMAALAHAPDPANALARFDNVVEALPSAINFFNLLDARPALLQLLADILSYAPTLADALARRGELLEGLIDTSAYRLPEGCDALAAELDARIVDDDYQNLLDLVRAFVGEKRFAFGVQLVEGQQDPLAVSRAYAMLAEIAVARLTSATVAEFERTHGKVPGGELAILALGRFGGEALTHASDLDLILLFTGDHGAESDGPRALGATQYFNRLAQRVVGALTVATASGALYEVDTRLRPSGAQGLLCVSFDSFAKYQSEEAWTWEHMALTRARPVYGSPQARAQLQAIIAQTLAMPRDAARLADDIVKMRGDMATHKPPKGALDVKLLPGGLVDAEFVIHALQLRFGTAFHPQLDRAADALIAEALLPDGFAAAQALLTRLLVMLRLVAPDCEVPPEAARAVVAKALGFADWGEVMSAVDAARAVIGAEWQGIGPRLKI
ncbi:bifunctional [glutamine synthetase] adenylyltransferase/[glutamine synthetase]-adenylyl-L-tyrosine phosphorylase [Sphingorhabdus sp.]|uniref:bifunctional [glutamine synthetase] adenylyltransferase/[glutamine synthetase]-adenylyl-L-tyrosine phosphorylase n=1 Tax=Sphingorhabdus sp. TaxID=1902408 RepID=UPI0035B04D74|nr:bifunctional [glutamine synthetase] adenylyltransferase/[glutamine synthetase]-adenylyl-L-tyrosine phosphorylase [Sphingomonadaceae bacterium]